MRLRRYISGNALSSTVPSEGFVDIRRMAALRQFDASNNAIVGTIPPALAGLPALRLLDLSRNALHGTGATLLRF